MNRPSVFSARPNSPCSRSLASTTGVRRLLRKFSTPVRTKPGVAVRYMIAAGSRSRPSRTRLNSNTARLTGSIGSFSSVCAPAGLAAGPASRPQTSTAASPVPAAPRQARRLVTALVSPGRGPPMSLSTSASCRVAPCAAQRGPDIGPLSSTIRGANQASSAGAAGCAAPAPHDRTHARGQRAPGGRVRSLPGYVTCPANGVANPADKPHPVDSATPTCCR